MTKARALATVWQGIVVGAAGGLAEVAWVTLYGWLTGGDPAILARGVTTASGVSALLPGSAVSLGVGVHMTLAAILGVALAFAWRWLSRRGGGSGNPYPCMLIALTGVWAVNFFVLLPVINPEFIVLVAWPVSLTSKLLFGVAAAWVLRHQATVTVGADEVAAVGD